MGVHVIVLIITSVAMGLVRYRNAAPTEGLGGRVSKNPRACSSICNFHREEMFPGYCTNSLASLHVANNNKSKWPCYHTEVKETKSPSYVRDLEHTRADVTEWRQMGPGEASLIAFVNVIKKA